jgi:NADH dehydrogenase FAD-containing subunit
MSQSPQQSSARTLLLIGGGHTHALLLLHARRHFPADARLVMVSPERFVPYSGMLPGLVSGHYRYRDCHIDLAHLCREANVELIYDRVTGLDLDDKAAITSAGQRVAFDLGDLAVAVEDAEGHARGRGEADDAHAPRLVAASRAPVPRRT